MVSICALIYGDHPKLAHRCLGSIAAHCANSGYRLIVGANEPCPETARLLDRLRSEEVIHELVVSRENLNKCPMMRRLFEKVDTDLAWWFDDDSYIEAPNALQMWLQMVRNSPPTTVMWGQLKWCDSSIEFSHLNDQATLDFVRGASWYRGLPPPSWRPGGKGEFNFRGKGTGDGRWHFITGGCWMIKTSAIRALDWPDRRLAKMGDDVFLGEAIRQQGWQFMDIGSPGVAINTEPRRGVPG